MVKREGGKLEGMVGREGGSGEKEGKLEGMFGREGGKARGNGQERRKES